MRLLLDEDVPVQLLDPLKHLLKGHDVDHVQDLGWKGKKDRHMLLDARQKKYDALLTNDRSQLADVKECRFIKQSGLHHIRYSQDTAGRAGIDGLALAIASVVATIRAIMRELEHADGQRLVEIHAIPKAKRYAMTDPRSDPPPYWPGGQRSRG
jgi:predicted nuclease of predicted toxin-antitoxin system